MNCHTSARHSVARTAAEQESELIIMVTPEYVSPAPASQFPRQGPGMFTDTPTDMRIVRHGSAGSSELRRSVREWLPELYAGWKMSELPANGRLMYPAWISERTDAGRSSSAVDHLSIIRKERQWRSPSALPGLLMTNAVGEAGVSNKKSRTVVRQVHDRVNPV